MFEAAALDLINADEIDEAWLSDQAHRRRIAPDSSPSSRELAEVRADIEKKMLGELREKAQKEYVKGIKGQALVTVNNDVLQSVSSRPIRAKALEP